MKAVGTINKLSVDAENKKAMGGSSRLYPVDSTAYFLKPEKGVVWKEH